LKGKSRLVLLGSVRDDDDAKRVYELRLLAHELGVKEQVEFVLNAPWKVVLGWLGKSWVGVNAMWNEHFGIGVVEYLAAGLVGVVHDSGGPKEDIVVEGLGRSPLFFISFLTPCAINRSWLWYIFCACKPGKTRGKRNMRMINIHRQQKADINNRLPRNRYPLLRLRLPKSSFPPPEGCPCSKETRTGVLCTILGRSVCQGMARGDGGFGGFDAASEKVFLVIAL